MNGRYLIIGYQRSGTTALHTLLSGHPNTACFAGELREPFFSKGLTSFNGGYQTELEEQRGHGLLFDAVTGAHANSDTQARGAKTVCNSPKIAKVVNDVVTNKLAPCKVIVIERKDLVAQYGSRLVTKRTGVYHSYKNSADSVQTVKIDRRLFQHYAMVVKRTYEEVAKLEQQVPYLHLTQEEFLNDIDDVYRRALTFLELPYAEPTWFSTKKLLPHASTYIDHYEELAALQAQTHADLDAGKISRQQELFLRGYKRLRHDLFNPARWLKRAASK